MIDTIKFQFRVEMETYMRLKHHAMVYVRRDYVMRRDEIRYMQAKINIPSHDYHVTVSICDEVERKVTFECSLPKLCFGENVSLLYPSQLERALKYLWSFIAEIDVDFPSYEKWTIERLDLCYAWKFPNKEHAKAILNHLKLLSYPRKNKSVYNTSVMFAGRQYTPKFYLKEHEFMRHDFNRLIKTHNFEFADKTADLSVGVLRFEVTARKYQLIHWFKKLDIYYTDILNQSKLESILNDCLNKILQNRTPVSMNDETIMQKLELKWGHTKGARLFAFYNTYYSDSPHRKAILEGGYNPSTIWRKKRDIADAGVGIRNDGLGFEFNLSIPSDLVVNPDPVPKV